MLRRLAVADGMSWFVCVMVTVAATELVWLDRSKLIRVLAAKGKG